MAPRGSQGYDFSPIFSHYILLFTFVLAIPGWITAFIGQIVTTNKNLRPAVGTGWFAIFLQLFVIVGVLHTLATDAIAMHRFQLSVFTAVALVFAVIVVNDTIFVSRSYTEATAAGWLLLAIVDIIWVFFFTSEEDSLQLHLLNSFGTGGLTGPGRHSRRATMGGRSSNMGMGGGGGGAMSGGYGNYGGGAIGGVGTGGASVRGMSGNGIGSIGHKESGANVLGSGASGGAGTGASAPLITGSGAANLGDQSIRSHNTGTGGEADDVEGFAYKAKALYAYTASADDPNEISFTKGEILEILDNTGKWWQAKKLDGTRGIAPSNYLQII